MKLVFKRIMTKTVALYAAKVVSKTGCKHVVREYYGTFLVVPLYIAGTKNYDPGYAGLGTLIVESL